MEDTSQTSNKEISLVTAYLMLRMAIGVLGTALPFIVSIGAWILWQTGIQESISRYYYTGTRDVFVGTLFAIGVFLVSYKGYNEKKGDHDNIAGNFAGAFAVGVALFPTTPPAGASSHDKVIGAVHLVFASLLFLTLAYYSLCLFTKKDANASPRKLQRNRIYRICGYTIVACIALVVVIRVLLPNELRDSLQACHSIFWLESIAVVAFGSSWLIKYGALWADQA